MGVAIRLMSALRIFFRRYAGFAVSAVFVYYLAFHSGVSYEDFVFSIKNVRVLDLCILACLYLIPYPIRAWRACILLPHLDFPTSLGGVFVGYAANNILPFRLGEVVRAQVVGRYTGNKRSLVLSSVLVERIFDGFAIVLLLFLGAASLPLPDWALQARVAGLALFSTALIGLLIAGRTASFWERLLEKFAFFEPVREIAAGLLEGVRLATRGWASGFAVLFLSFLIWGLEGFMYWYGLVTFGIAGNFLEALFVLGIVNLGVLLPSSPGFVGVFEACAQKSLAVLGVAKSLGLAYGVVLHILQYVPVTLIGMIYFYRYGVRLSQVSVPEEEGLPVAN